MDPKPSFVSIRRDGTWTRDSNGVILLHLLSPGREPARAKHDLEAFPPSHISPSLSPQINEAVILNNFHPAHGGNVITLAFTCTRMSFLLAAVYTWELKGAG